MEKRERRRARDLRRARRAQREHLRVAHPDGALDCVCERSAGYFRKRRALGCNCRRRKAGAPKRGTGCCYAGPRPAWQERLVGRRLAAAWRARLRAGLLADDVDL